MYVHVWYDCHNQKVGCIERISSLDYVDYVDHYNVVMVLIVERILKLVMTYQVESQTRTTLKTACWPPSSFPWAAPLLLLLLSTGLLLLLLQPVPEGLAWSAGAACELRCASEAGPTHLWSLTDRARTNQRTTPIYLFAQLRASLPATLIALPKMFLMTQ